MRPNRNEEISKGEKRGEGLKKKRERRNDKSGTEWRDVSRPLQGTLYRMWITDFMSQGAKESSLSG